MYFAIMYGNNNMVYIFLPKLTDEKTEILKILVCCSMVSGVKQSHFQGTVKRRELVLL